MEANWEYCLKAILLVEGGNDDDPHDPGGRTSRGIIQREYNAYRRLNKLPPQDVWKASSAEIAAIYHTSYWIPYCADLPNGVDLEFFDMAVNAGMHEAIILLQRALGVKADGHIGIVTRTAISNIAPRNFVAFYSTQRRLFYQGLKG